MKLPENRILFALLIFLSISTAVQSQVYCSGETPFFSVDLTGNPSGTWVSPAVVRDGTCCGGGANQVNCIELAITLDSAAVGINFAVASGANPGGSLYYQINCQDVPVATGGAPICLEGVGPHYISYCKVGNNQNTYAITSIPGPSASQDIITAEGCSQQVSITGVDPVSVNWTSLSPGTQGQYNNLLTNIDGTATGTSGIPFAGGNTVNVTPTVGSPSTVQYQVCGNVSATCLTSLYCDTVAVTIVPTLDVAITPAAPYLCYGQPFVTLSANAAGGLAPFSYLWSNGQTTSTINVTTAGTYSVTVSDATGCPVATDQVTVIQFTQPVSANAGPDLIICPESSDIAVSGAVTGVTTGIWSGGGGTYAPDVTSLSLSYSPSAAEMTAGTATLTLTTTNTGTCPAVSDQVTISVSQLTITATNLQNPSCFGGVDGSVLIDAAGGVLPYSYSLNGGAAQPSNAFGNLAAGNYTVTVTSSTGCSSTVSFTISSPPQLVFSTSTLPVTCFGSCDGEITVNASGGTAPYMYSSNNGTTYDLSNVLTSLCAGTTGVVVQDVNGCLTNANVVITQPTALSATYALANPVCYESCDGSVTVTGAGGTPSYQYSVDGGALQSSANLSGLCAGNHTIVITDANGCQFSTVQNLVNPPAYGIDLVSMTASNCGFNDGAITVTANGANGPFMYSINGGTPQSSGTFTNFVAGSYSFTATDALGCQAQTFLGINDIEMDGTLIDQGDVTCFGGNDGWVTVTNSAGAAPITFELDNSGLSQTGGLFGDLYAGSHIITIYDAGFCVFTVPFMVTQPDEIQFTTSSAPVSCFGGSDGEITVNSPVGGTGTYTYGIDGGAFQTAAVFTGLSAGTHTVSVQDQNGCIVSAVETITEPTPVTYEVSTTNLTCFENASGYILVSGAGGQGPYQFSIDNGSAFQSDPLFFGLAAGTYSLIVQDAEGCNITGSIVLTQPTQLTAVYAPQAVSCFGVCNGGITISSNGGTSPYIYSHDNGVTLSTSPSIMGLCSGAYMALVRDDNGCEITSPAAIGSPPGLSLEPSATPSTCGLPNGSVSTVASGGTPGYTYSIDNVSFAPAATFTDLAAGSYTIYVNDAQGCPASVEQTVLNQPSPVVTGVVSTNATCSGTCNGSLTITASGGTGTVEYTVGGAFQLSNVFTDLCAGSYDLSVTDANGCITDYSVPFIITEPVPLTFTAEQTDLTCFGNGTGTIGFTAQGGTSPYAYSINDGADLSSSSYFILLDAATYPIVVTDANGCTASGQVVLSQPPLLEITDLQATDAICFEACNGTATVSAQGGTVQDDYTYNWYTVVENSQAPQITDLCAGSYTSVVLDDNGCYDTVQFTISDPLPVMLESIVTTDPLCSGSCNGTITLSSPDANLYSFDGGVTFVSSPTMTNLCEGTYDVYVQTPEGCLASEDGVTLTDPLPLSVVAGPDSTICFGEPGTISAQAEGGTVPYTYYWNNGDGPNIQIVTPMVNSAYNIYVHDANGCVSNIDSTLFIIYQVLTTAVSSDTTICPGGQVNLFADALTGVPGYTYTWLESGSNIANTAEIAVSPEISTTYIVQTSDLCSVVSDTLNIDVYAIPEATFDVSQTEGCTPMDIGLFSTLDPAVFGGNCTWTFSDGSVVNGCDTVHAIFTDPGCYSVTFAGESSEGCPMTGYGENVFCVLPNPEADFYYNPEAPTYLSPEVAFSNTSSYSDSYAWSFSGYGTSNEENPFMSFFPSEPGDDIDVCLTAYNYLGCSSMVCKPVVIGDVFVIYVPNAFTPDGNEFNNVFGPVFPEEMIISDYELLIFDRWGEVIFESHNPKEGWGGDYAGQIVQDGVYTWKIGLKDDLTNDTHQLVGHVSLLR